MELVVRRGLPEDAPGLARLRWRWRIEERGEVTEISRESFVDYFATWIRDNVRTHLPFVAQVDGRLAGVAWLCLSVRVPAPKLLDRRTGDIQAVYVIPELRGSGVGAGLIQAIVRHARDIELSYLTVHSAAEAVGFYQHLGFVDNDNWLAYRL